MASKAFSKAFGIYQSGYNLVRPDSYIECCSRQFFDETSRETAAVLRRIAFCRRDEDYPYEAVWSAVLNEGQEKLIDD